MLLKPPARSLPANAKILLLQTAFPGDVVLATALAESLHITLPKARIYFLVRKGNESLFAGHQYIKDVWVWDKKKAKYKGLFDLLGRIRAERFEVVVNVQRFGASGLLTALSGAGITSGFSKNPFSSLFTYAAPHQIGNGLHETERNQALIAPFTQAKASKPKLYPQAPDYAAVADYQSVLGRPAAYVCIAPASVWFTKQFPAEKWAELIPLLTGRYRVFLLGGPPDFGLCQSILEMLPPSVAASCTNLAGKLSFLQSGALMQGAAMNYVNDSAPQHLASAVNAPVTAIFCSTVPAFGFGPLSSVSHIVQTELPLPCRPCGLHGYARCPETHFKCANTISVSNIPLP